MNGCRFGIGMFIGAALLARVFSLFVIQPAAPPTAMLERHRLARQLASEIVSSQPYCFDASAAVILGCGHDGLPGHANEDDNLNGVIDDRGEMGAVGSDDLCLSPADNGYDIVADAAGTMVISRGSYVRCADQDTAMPKSPARFLTENFGWFFNGRHQDR